MSTGMAGIQWLGNLGSVSKVFTLKVGCISAVMQCITHIRRSPMCFSVDLCT